jgi:SNW domain-containing protein 1
LLILTSWRHVLLNRERERERRLEAREAHGFKKSKLTRDRDRDISEKIALGMAKVTGGEAMYDQRLFNQDVGTGAGGGAEDSYNIYDKPLFADRAELFKHTGRRDEETYASGGGGGGGGGADVDTSRFKPDKGFTGADYGKGGEGGAVQFEKEAEEADPFGLDAFLSDVRGGKKKGALDDIGKRGGMGAGGGGGSYEDQHAGGSGRRREFVSGGR